ncbi:MAG: carboxypeptidase-like regulatory domain-containing protein, partial [Taibaiella sp.]|nr:carboxypeptidase-like regulatory domain-containing protein [Taibaiella sp.]
MNYRWLLLICGWFFSFCSPATAGKITGRVLDEKGETVAAATVVLLNPGDNSLVRSAITDDKGIFVLENNTAGTYQLKVTTLGYNTHSREIALAAEDITLPDIRLEAKSNK